MATMVGARPEDHRRVLVAGGGIGGLATALALARAGFPVLVLERAAALGEVGAGVQLGPNAFHALDRLGVGEAARDQAIFIEALRLMDATTAEEIARVDLGPSFRAWFGNPYAVIHRGDLHGVLLGACRALGEAIEIRVGCEVAGYEQGDHVTARLSNGETVAGAALVGADGLWSKVRRQLVGDGPPRVPGHTTFRSVIPIELMPEDLRWNAATLWAGPRCHIVHYPLSGWRLFNFAITVDNGATSVVSGEPVEAQEVERSFAHVHEKARAVIRHGRDWKRWVLCDREPVERWVDGRVTLLGDAAHPMLQYLAQGACMALEDAVCLGDTFRESDGQVGDALEAYRDRRLVRTARVQLQSRAVGEHIYHPSGAHAVVRNTLLRAKSHEDLYRDLAWLYAGATGAVGEGLGTPSAPARSPLHERTAAA